MVDPLLALILGSLGLILLSLVFWPGKGLTTRWKRAYWSTEKVLIEDALKHLYDCEYKDVPCTLHSVAGNLSISGDKATRLISRLESMGLVQTGDETLQLTSEGRSYALRVIRVHRLWEKFLAEETSVSEIDWHNKAEEIEHVMTPEETNRLAARLGNPILDPHGDPIPSAKGKIPSRKGKPITILKSGDTAEIIHIEDEPQAVYSQIVAEGLHPGMQVKIIDSSSERIRFDVNGEECILAPLIAANITVIQTRQKEDVKKSFRTLSSLNIGQEASVLRISRACRGLQRRRLMDFGLVPGTRVKAEMVSVGGDPVAYNIRGATVALRKNEADRIFIQDVDVKEEM